MKKITLTLLAFLSYLFVFAQPFPKKQTLIPLNNVSGVPFMKDPDVPIDLLINGFEIDAKGNFYFFGGKLPCLAVFSGTKQIYRKTYNELDSGTGLNFYKGNSYNYAFDSKGKQIFIKLNMADGTLHHLNSSLLSKHFNAHTIVDSCIILLVPAENTNAYSFEEYDLSGKFLKRVTNKYGIPAFIFPDKKDNSDWELVGKWNRNFVFWTINTESSKYEKLCMVDKNGKILAIKSLPDNFSGGGYAENPNEDRKVRNGSFFVLGRKGHYAVITEVPLQSLFGR